MDLTIYGAELWDIANEQVINTAKCTKTHGWFGGPLAIEGKITNNSSETIHNGHVEFGLFDRRGRKIGKTTASCEFLAPRETWRYKAPIIVNGCATFKLSGLHW